jgi:hypothetical protein
MASHCKPLTLFDATLWCWTAQARARADCLASPVLRSRAYAVETGWHRSHAARSPPFLDKPRAFAYNQDLRESPPPFAADGLERTPAKLIEQPPTEGAVSRDRRALSPAGVDTTSKALAAIQ